MHVNMGEAQGTPVIRRTRTSELTRDRLLEAGYRLLMERGMSSTLPVRVADVVSSVGQTTGAAYQLWANQAEFQRALAEYSLQKTTWAGPVVLADQVSTAVDRGASFSDALRILCSAYLDCLVKDPGFSTYLHFWAVALREDDLRALIQSGYERFQPQFTQMYGTLLREFGLQVADPYSLDDLATTITAVVEGLALRHLVDAARSGRSFEFDEEGSIQRWSLLACAVEAIIVGFTEPS